MSYKIKQYFGINTFCCLCLMLKKVNKKIQTFLLVVCTFLVSYTYFGVLVVVYSIFVDYFSRSPICFWVSCFQICQFSFCSIFFFIVLSPQHETRGNSHQRGSEKLYRSEIRIKNRLLIALLNTVHTTRVFNNKTV